MGPKASQVPEQFNPPAHFPQSFPRFAGAAVFVVLWDLAANEILIAAMSPLETLSLVLGAGFASGLNVYATVATLGLLQRFGVIHLPEQLQVLSHPFVLAIAGILYLMEFLADKVPIIDSVWQAIHTFIRPPAAALLAFSATAAAPEPWRWAAALVAGSIALTSHGTKASARAAANISPEPLSNWALSFGEDVLAVWLTWFATAHPAVAIIVVALLFAISLYLLYHLFRFLRRTFRKLAET
jgi:uncharacterized protein DUF4126